MLIGYSADCLVLSLSGYTVRLGMEQVRGDVLTIHISHDLQPHTTYYYNVSLVAVDRNISARVFIQHIC